MHVFDPGTVHGPIDTRSGDSFTLGTGTSVILASEKERELLVESLKYLIQDSVDSLRANTLNVPQLSKLADLVKMLEALETD